MTNHMHLISAAMSFNMKIPSSFDSLFSRVNRVSSPNESFFSFDCFIKDYEIKLFAPSNSLFKLFLFLFLPIFLIGVIIIGLFIVNLVLYLFKKHKMFDQKRAIVVSMICIIFLFHPTLTLESLSVFLCNQIDADEYRMTMHLEYRCYSLDHLKWSAFVGMPILLLWVIASPILALMILTRHRKNLEDWSIKKYMLIIYQGFKPEVYY